jgi:hypothetical protein
MVICRANSGQTKIEHFKFRVELVQVLLIEHQSESVRKFESYHSTDKNVPRLVERHFPERIPQTEKKARRTKRCVIKTIERRQCFGAPNVKLPYVLKNFSRHSTPS